jgi:putative tryptophan/tyrosine transport system substrate-binding protein
MIRRRQFIGLVGGAAAAWPLSARAQQSERMRRIGMLTGLPESDPEARTTVALFRQGMDALGWAEGRNVRIDYRYAAGDTQRIEAFAKELVELRPDLIVARSSPVVAVLLKQTRTIPIVFLQVVDPVRQGFVASLSRPEGNVTGFTPLEAPMGSKWLEILKEAAPRVEKVAVVFNPDVAPFAGDFFRAMETAAPSFAVQMIAAPIRDSTKIERTINAFAREPNGGLLVIPDAFTAAHRNLIIAAAARHYLPAVYGVHYFASSGGLISYGSDTADVIRRMSSYVDRILKGEKPANLPVQAPTKHELVINLKTAKALGLEIPPSVLARADEVIE